MLTIFLLACGAEPVPVPEPEPARDPRFFQFSEGEPVTLSDAPEAELACLRQECAQSANAEIFATCRATTCAKRTERFSVHPDRIRYADGTFFAEVSLEHEAASHGPIPVARDREVYLGVTVITEAGEEIDLAVQTLFATRLEDSFVFSADVGPGVQDVIIGAWDEKIEPCEVDRYGCREFGFVLDGPLASWPPDFYHHAHKQRIPPETLVVAAPKTLPNTARDRLKSVLSPFEVSVDWSGEAAVQGVHYRHPHDWMLAHALGGENEPVHSPDLPVDLAIGP